MLPMVGTIRNAVKLAELDGKWQQKKKNGGRKEKAEQEKLDPQLKKYQEDMDRMRESRRMSSIDTKLSAGAALSEEELAYLKENSPELYRQALEVRREKESYERQLKACRTKEEAEKLKVNRMGSFMAEAKTVMNNPNIPEGKKKELMEKLMKKVEGVLKTDRAFKESAQYQGLPDKEDVPAKTAEQEEVSSGSRTLQNEEQGLPSDTGPQPSVEETEAAAEAQTGVRPTAADIFRKLEASVSGEQTS